MLKGISYNAGQRGSDLSNPPAVKLFTESEGCGGALIDGIGNEDISPLCEAVVWSWSE